MEPVINDSEDQPQISLHEWRRRSKFEQRVLHAMAWLRYAGRGPDIRRDVRAVHGGCVLREALTRLDAAPGNGPSLGEPMDTARRSEGIE